MITKDNYYNEFIDMMKHSWTYQLLTEDEKKRLHELLSCFRIQEVVKGTPKQRYNVLNALFFSFLTGVGYDGYNWRQDTDTLSEIDYYI